MESQMITVWGQTLENGPHDLLIGQWLWMLLSEQTKLAKRTDDDKMGLVVTGDYPQTLRNQDQSGSNPPRTIRM